MSCSSSRLRRDVAGDAVIVAAEIAGGHDGNAEIVVSLRYENGRIDRVVLDTDAGLRLMKNCGAAQLSELEGHSWRDILEDNACSTSSSRTV
jgi:hypothetical protein